MNKKLILLFLTVGMFASISTAQAVLILDTGLGDNAGALSLRNGTDTPLVADGFRWLAGQFELNDDYNIEALQASILYRPSLEGPDTLDIISYVLYGDDHDSVDQSREFFRQTSETVPVNFDAFWFGPSGLDIDLSAGKYWLALEVPNKNDFIGHVQLGAPNPLALYAIQTDGTGGRYQTFNSSLGFRVEGSVIPEPASMVLFGTGLLGAMVRRRLKV